MRQEREISVRILTERFGFSLPEQAFGALAKAGLPDDPDSEDEPEEDEPEELPFSTIDEAASKELEKPETGEFFAIGKLVETDDRLEIVYEESVLTGMEGSLTTIGFAKSEPEVVTMVRQGFVDTAFVFEQGKRHLSVYQTPFAEFELGVCARTVNNLLLREGLIELDYITELRGARAERCKMKITIG